MRRHAPVRRLVAARALLAMAALATLLAACDRGGVKAEAAAISGGDPQRGRAAIRAYGCGSCHQVPGIRSANAVVGPSLELLAERLSIAGAFPHTPETLIAWIQHPQRLRPGTLMPDMNISEADARDIAAYLYTLR